MTFIIKKLLNEQIFDKTSKQQIELFNGFVIFACQYLKIPKPSILLTYKRDNLVTTASYGDKKVVVYAKDRATVDIMRSIAHELTHMKQDVNNELKKASHNDNNAAGSPIEDEANSMAGEIMRKFGEKHPEIYE